MDLEEQKNHLKQTSTFSGWMADVEKFASTAAEQEGCYLYDIEFSGTGAGRTLRVYIDKVTTDNAEGTGAGIEDCSNVSKSLNLVLDADENIIPGGAYMLEVSTPGLDRTLRLPWHFEKVVGQKIWLRTKEALETYGVELAAFKKAKTVEKELHKVEAGKLYFETKEGDLVFPMDAVEKAKVVFEMNKGQKRKK